jgi:hypothetical protein
LRSIVERECVARIARALEVAFGRFLRTVAVIIIYITAAVKATVIVTAWPRVLWDVWRGRFFLWNRIRT